MRRVAAACLAVALLISPAVALAQSSVASALADAIRPDLPRRYGGDVVLVAVEAEGTLLVVTIEIPAETRLSREQIAQVFAGGFCGGDNDMGKAFEQGLTIRVDARRGRAPLEQGLVIDRCPEAAPPPSV